MADEGQQVTAALRCPNCDASGAVVWEDHEKPRAPQRRLVFLHGEFHAEAGRANSGGLVIVCNACDEIQPD